MRFVPYNKTDWEDHIVDIEYGDVIQEGTRFTAKRANNIEEGIFNLHVGCLSLEDTLTRIQIHLEMIGRVPINNGTFYDTLDGVAEAKALQLLKQNAVSQNELIVGSTEIVVDDATVFKIGEHITIFDDINIETKKIIGILENTITVLALEKEYKKGAIICRSNADIKCNKIIYQAWGNYNIEVKEVI